MTCTYPPLGGDYEGGSYALVVHTRDGRTERIATWNGLPGATMQLTAATASHPRADPLGRGDPDRRLARPAPRAL